MREGMRYMYEALLEILVLFLLGACGWALFSLLRLPVPALLGTIVFVGYFRLNGYALPPTPNFLSPLIQIVLGLYVGSKVTRDTVRELRAIFPAAVIIAGWALGVVFILGLILTRFTYLDPATAILSSSMGGLPEMTVIALSTNADIAVILIIQFMRMIGTIVLFPVIIHAWMKKNGGRDYIEEPASAGGIGGKRGAAAGVTRLLNRWKELRGSLLPRSLDARRMAAFLYTAGRGLSSLAIAAAGGLLFLELGVPAGAMVGSMFFAAAASLMRFPLMPPSFNVFGFLLVGVGLLVTDNLLPGTFVGLLSGSLLGTVILSTGFIFLSSLLVSLAIQRFAGWDFPTSFLAAAPGGFTVMTTLALKYKKDPLRVSMLHLCRLLAIKSVLPFVFMLFF